MAACELTPGASPSVEPLSEGEVVMRGVVFDRFEGGALKERVEADRVRLVRSKEELWAEQVRARRLGEAPGQPPRATVMAPRGHLVAGEDAARLSGGVTVTDPEGRVLETASLTHSAAQDRLHTDDPVVVRGADFRLEGHGFELQLDTEALTIGGPVRARIDEAAAADQPSPR